MIDMFDLLMCEPEEYLINVANTQYQTPKLMQKGQAQILE